MRYQPDRLPHPSLLPFIHPSVWRANSGSPLYFSTHSSMNSMIFRLGRESIHLSPSAARWVACVAALRNRPTTARSSSEKPASTPFISSM